MGTRLERDGLYATFRGRRYSANRDTGGELVVTTSDPAAKALGFVDRYGVGTYTRVVGPGEVTALERVRHVGTYRDEPVNLSVNPRGGVLVGTADEHVAARLRLARVDKAWWETEVPQDDPALVITEVHEPVGPGASSAGGPDVDRYFARFGAERIPQALLRRHFTPAGHEDQILTDVGQWRPDTHGSVARAVLYPTESDLEPVTAAQAAAIEQMVGERRYRPL